MKNQVGIPRLDDALVKACKRGAGHRIAHLVAEGASPDALTKNGQTVLQWAAVLGKDAVCRALLLAGADVERKATTESNKATALMLAAGSGHAQTCRVLLENGARVDTQDSAGSSALHQAVYWSGEDVVKTLLEKQSNPNAVDHQGNTPLHLAVSWTRLGSALLLLDAGADPDQRNHSGMSAKAMVKAMDAPAMQRIFQSWDVRAAALQAIADMTEGTPSQIPVALSQNP